MSACDVEAVHTLSAADWAVIDLDSGTVLGTRIALVPLPTDDDWREAIQSSDADAIAYAAECGSPLYRLSR